MRNFLINIDSFDKTENVDFVVDTRTGIMMSNAISFLSSFLMFAQILLAISPKIHRDLMVPPKSTVHSDMVNISLNILVSMPCELLHLDIVDSLGFSGINQNTTVTYKRMSDTNGFLGLYHPPAKEKCFPCFEVLSNKSCCNGCNTLKELYKIDNRTAHPENWPQCQPENIQHFSKIEKCQIKGKITVNRVDGSFHIAPGRNYPSNRSHYHELNDDYPSLGMQHTILGIRFGPNIPAASNPLMGISMFGKNEMPTSYNYQMVVTPVLFFADGQYIEKGFEYTGTVAKSTVLPHTGSPGLYFDYTFSPFTISVTWKSRSFRGFLVSTGGLIAGLYSIFALIYDRLERRSKDKEEKKQEKQQTTE